VSVSVPSTRKESDEGRSHGERRDLRRANWASKIGGKLRANDDRELLDFGKLEDGFFEVEVPRYADGALWKFENSQGQRLLTTVPPYLARTGEELLLPREVVEKDALK